MIAPIKTRPAVTSVTTTSTQSVVTSPRPVVTPSAQTPTFESLLPALTTKFKKAAMSLPSWHDRRDAVDEMIAMSFTCYRSLVNRKVKAIYPTPLGDYAVKSYFGGRRFLGMSSVDVFAARCQLRGRATINNDMIDHCICKKTGDPAVIGAFRVDFKDWIRTLDDRMRNVLHEILIGSTTGEISDLFKVSPGRISQVRKLLYDSWNEFVAEHSGDDEEDES
jgi:hypothetical protein